MSQIERERKRWERIQFHLINKIEEWLNMKGIDVYVDYYPEDYSPEYNSYIPWRITIYINTHEIYIEDIDQENIKIEIILRDDKGYLASLEINPKKIIYEDRYGEKIEKDTHPLLDICNDFKSAKWFINITMKELKKYDSEHLRRLLYLFAKLA